MFVGDDVCGQRSGYVVPRIKADNGIVEPRQRTHTLFLLRMCVHAWCARQQGISSDRTGRATSRLDSFHARVISLGANELVLRPVETMYTVGDATGLFAAQVFCYGF